MSIKLEASDQVVVDYLHKLWNNPINSDSINNNTNSTNLTTNDTNLNLTTNEKKYSLLQSLINYNIIGNASVTNIDDKSEGGAEKVNVEAIEIEHKTIEYEIEDKTIEYEIVEQSVAEPKNSDLINQVTELNEDINELDLNAKLFIKQVEGDNDNEQVKDDNEQVKDDNENEQVNGDNKSPDNSSELSESEVQELCIALDDKKGFKKQVKENLKKIREIGFRVYQNVGLEKEVNLVVKSVSNEDINKVYNFKVSGYLTRKNLMSDIARCVVFPKYKSGDATKPENFRYLVNHHNVVKILDRLWCVDVINSCGTNLPDKNIYKANLVRAFNGSIIDTAIANTNSTESVVLLDIAKAFDSLDWNVLEELLLNNLTRKSSKEKATELVDQYMTIMKNRELYYNNNLISISKGISTGLPSSNLVFTLALEEILFRWFNKYNYKNNEDFVMSVYVDDIHIKILQILKADEIVKNLISHLELYKLNVNFAKSKVCPNLNVDFPNKLSTSDFYLGIPFTRDIKLYGQLILAEFQKNKMNMTWLDIYDKLCRDKSDETTSIIVGYFNYKLKPLIVQNENESTKDTIKKFIFNNYVKAEVNARSRRNYIIASVSIVILAVLFSKISNN